eukprot:Gregarina_sp_Poly_1__7690@NODE_432_length_8476_cov_39_955524_g352_i0_p6_GENE_NODE_432_length_8476_cov_39_955524_g352_i0NODE_432_length_8476_cov_39_955524_g352_i0_p6_ORF_typecomplete_len263_score21_69RMI1_N/PF08585_12/0_002_NODE_432_length_8476_cov_39_955524_g352_i027023490
MDEWGLDGTEFEYDKSDILKLDLRHFTLRPKNSQLIEVKTGLIDFPGCLLLQLVKSESISERKSRVEDDEETDSETDILIGRGRMKYICALGKCRLTLVEGYCFPDTKSRDFIPGSKLLLRGRGIQPQLDIVNSYVILHGASQIEWIGGTVESQMLAFEVGRVHCRSILIFIDFRKRCRSRLLNALRSRDEKVLPLTSKGQNLFPLEDLSHLFYHEWYQVYSFLYLYIYCRNHLNISGPSPFFNANSRALREKLLICVPPSA